MEYKPNNAYGRHNFMIAAPIPHDEDKRLQALRALLILDTPPEERFNRITAFAAFEFDVPIVLLSLIDDDRQWCKSTFGTDFCSSSRDISFCGHTILQDQIMVIEDASQDVRFHDNPLVIGEPHIRFYAGAQLVLPTGEAVGSFCLIDRKPRTLDENDLSILSTLRQMVVTELVANNDKPVDQ